MRLSTPLGLLCSSSVGKASAPTTAVAATRAEVKETMMLKRKLCRMIVVPLLYHCLKAQDRGSTPFYTFILLLSRFCFAPWVMADQDSLVAIPLFFILLRTVIYCDPRSRGPRWTVFPSAPDAHELQRCAHLWGFSDWVIGPDGHTKTPDYIFRPPCICMSESVQSLRLLTGGPFHVFVLGRELIKLQASPDSVGRCRHSMLG